MKEVLIGLAAMIGSGGVLSLIAFGLLNIVKGSIATAVKQAGDREIERLRHDLGREAEREKQAIAKLATIEIKRVEVGLSLEAEVRRQVAARKVAVVGEIIAKADTIVGRSNEYGQEGYIDELNALGQLLRHNKHLFRRPVVKAFEKYLGEIVVHGHNVKHDYKPETFREIGAATENIIAIVRAELHVDEEETSS